LPREVILSFRVAAELLKKLKLVEVLQFEYQLQAASCNNCKQLDKALSLEQRETNHFKWIKDQSLCKSEAKASASGRELLSFSTTSAV
jgi:hypothetical protein